MWWSHRWFHMKRPNVLPMFLQQRHQEVDWQMYVLYKFVSWHVDMTNSYRKAKYLKKILINKQIIFAKVIDNFSLNINFKYVFLNINKYRDVLITFKIFLFYSINKFIWNTKKIDISNRVDPFHGILNFLNLKIDRHK